MNKKNTALVFGGTAKDIIAMACLVLNIKETNINLADDIIIFHDGINEKDKALINAILPVRFIKYIFPIDDITDFNETITKYFSTMVFCKYECFKLLYEYHTVIWTDYDVVILKDLSELKKPTSSGFRMVQDPGESLRKMFFDTIDSIDMIQYDLTVSGICTPIFAFYDNMNQYDVYYDYCLKKTKEFARHLYLPEQCIFNLLLQDFKINIDPIPFELYSPHPLKNIITDETKIIHASGQPKFWNGLHNIYWEKNYKHWVRMGGEKLWDRTIKYKINKISRLLFRYGKYILPYGFVRLLQKMKHKH